MRKTTKIIAKAATLTAVISAATAMFWVAIAYFNRRTEKGDEISKQETENQNNG
ncbi:MAG: hypothetical protein IJS05_05940 [Paludibacteraceae bacterium]|nr:hypothetical protein [Paludibacteraceae bacterium]